MKENNIDLDLDQEEDAIDQQVETSCKNCIFETLPKQCDFDYPNRISEEKVELTREDDGQEHYRIQGLCKWFRDDLWKTANLGKDLRAIAEKENELNLSLVIIVRDDISGFDKTIESIQNQKIKPTRVLFVITSSDVDYIEFILKAKEASESTGLEIKAQSITDPEILKSDLLIIDEAFKEIRSGHYSVFELGYDIPENWTFKIDEAVNKEDKMVCYIKPIDGINGITAQTMMHKFLYGNKGASLEIKIEEGLEYDKNDTQMIFSWKELK